jgi:hypothetical protein
MGSPITFAKKCLVKTLGNIRRLFELSKNPSLKFESLKEKTN